MTRPVSFTLQARDDLDEIWAYIAQDNPTAADATKHHHERAHRSRAATFTDGKRTPRSCPQSALPMYP